MSRPRGIPSYRRHSSGQGVVTLTDPTGRRRDYLLGAYGTPESKTEYARIIAEWQEANNRLPGVNAPSDLTIAEMLLAFWVHVEKHYRHPDGTEVDNYRLSLRPLRQLYGQTQAAKFGPLALKAVRKVMIDSGLCRKVINQRISRIRRAFKWAVSEELVPPSVYHGLRAVDGLQIGRTEARDRPPVQPVDNALVEAILPYVNRHVRAMATRMRSRGPAGRRASPSGTPTSFVTHLRPRSVKSLGSKPLKSVWDMLGQT